MDIALWVGLVIAALGLTVSWVLLDKRDAERRFIELLDLPTGSGPHGAVFSRNDPRSPSVPTSKHAALPTPTYRRSGEPIAR
jgi:hypothetical protein